MTGHSKLHRQMESRGMKPAAAEITSLPRVTVPLHDAAAADADPRLVDALEENDDVKDVCSNAEFSET